jgi:endonuclease/exonuclease/phosphatase family metal-dependent hydrolase
VTRLTKISTLALLTIAGALIPTDRAGADCRHAAPGSGARAVRWVSVEPEIAALRPWCAAVGGPVVEGPDAAAVEAPVDSFVVVTWNVKGGAGALEQLVDELRRGALGNGTPSSHFALLVQEAVRVAGSVPPMPPDGASARTIGATDPTRSIEAVAARTGLHVFYAPSMRNGAELFEDRGNAILATLPLEDPVVIALPYERQRRAAIAARISLPLAGGEEQPLRLINAHFDNTSSRLWRSFGRGRTRQTRGLLEALDADEPMVFGGDLNTWFGETSEGSIALLRERFPLPETIPDTDTYLPPYLLPGRVTDYLLFRLPSGWRASYRVSEDWRDSDHAPLVGHIEPPARDATSGPASKEAK